MNLSSPEFSTAFFVLWALVAAFLLYRLAVATADYRKAKHVSSQRS